MLMTAYYLIKPVREALILASGGAEIKTYASTGQALVLLGVVPLYSRLASFLPRRRLIAVVLLFFATNLVVFYLLARAHVPLGVPFYLWVGIFNFMVVAQFWSFANDVYTPEEGKRLFAIVGFGMSAGAVSGSFIAGRLIGPLGTYQLMLLSAGLLAVSLILTAVVERRRAEPVAETSASPDASPEDMSGPNGFVLLLRSRYLLLIAAMMILANLVNTTGEYVLGARVKAAQEASVAQVVRAPGQTDAAYEAAVDARTERVGEGIGRFYADFFSVVNLAGLLIQLFLVSRIVKWFGVRWGILVLPLVAMGGYALMALLPAMGVVRWAKTAENATDYSLQNTARNMLFLPTTRQEKYKAKQAIDTFCVRVGDVAAALLVFVGTTWVTLSPAGFAGVNVVLAAVWVVVAVAIGRRFRGLTEGDGA
ncbi:MAG: translocase [bacterium]|nr:translocase [bacterium]